MNRCVLLALASVALLSGCRYPGAVYSQYTAVNLAVAARPEESKPVDINFGYLRGTATMVPKLQSDKHAREATSLLSRERVGATVDSRGNENVTVDAAFASGNAAVIASLPKGPFRVVASDGSTVLYRGKTTSDPAQRIRAAFKPTARFECAEQADMVAEFQKIGRLKDQFAADVFDKAANDLPADFRSTYEAILETTPGDKEGAFAFAADRFTKEDPPCGPKYVRILAELRKAQE